MKKLAVLRHINLYKPLTSYSTQPDWLLRKMVDKEMIMNFEHKPFGEKLITPGGSDFGVVFFRASQKGNPAGSPALSSGNNQNFSWRTAHVF